MGADWQPRWRPSVQVIAPVTFHEYQRVKPAAETRNANGEEDEMGPPYDQHWHLDKKVPITIIFAIIIQTFAFIWIGSAWKADVDARLKQLEVSDSERKPQESRLIRVEEKLLALTESNKRIEVDLKSLVQELTSNGRKP